MGIRWRHTSEEPADDVAAALWHDTARALDQRFDQFRAVRPEQMVDAVRDVLPQRPAEGARPA